MKLENIYKSSPPKTIENLRKKLGIGKHIKDKNTILKKLIKVNILTKYPTFSFNSSNTTKHRLIMTYTKPKPKLNLDGSFDRDDEGRVKLRNYSVQKYISEYSFPFKSQSEWRDFLQYLPNLQKQISEECEKIRRSHTDKSYLIDSYVNDFLSEKKGKISDTSYRNYCSYLGVWMLFWKRNSHKNRLLYTQYQLDQIKKNNEELWSTNKCELESDYQTNIRLEDLFGNDGKTHILLFLNQIQKPSNQRHYRSIEFVSSKPSTVKSYYIVIRTFINWCVRNDYIPYNLNPIRRITPTELPNFSKYERTIRKTLTPTDTDISKIYEWIDREVNDTPKEGRWGTKRRKYKWFLSMLMIYLKCGVRNSTVTNLLLEDVDWENDKVFYTTKGDVRGEFYLDTELKEWLEPIIIDGETHKVRTDRKYIFSSHYVTDNRPQYNNEEKPYNSQTVSTYFKSMVREINDYNGPFNTNLTVHSLRRYYINKMLREGKSLSLIRKSVNHSGYRTIMKYETEIIDDKMITQTNLSNPHHSKEDKINEIEQKIDQLKKELLHLDKG